MDVVLGANVTLTTLLDNPVYDYIVWNFNNGNAQVNVATQGKDKLTVNKKYQGRVSVDRATGNLILVGTTSADSGDYGITVLMADGVTQTAEIKLRVLGESFRWVPGPRVGDLGRPPHSPSQLFIVQSGATYSGFLSLFCEHLEVTCFSDLHA